MTPPRPSGGQAGLSSPGAIVRAVFGLVLMIAGPSVYLVALVLSLRSGQPMDRHVWIIALVMFGGGMLGFFPTKTLGDAGQIAKSLLPWGNKAAP